MPRNLISPFSNEPEKINLDKFVSTASTPAYSKPLSPMSKEPMQEVLCGTSDGPNFKVWVHVKDRLVIPYQN